MPSRLLESLRRRPVFFEPVPPSVRARPDRGSVYLEELQHRLSEVPQLDALDIPELVDENHDGRPYYRTADPRAFGRAAASRLSCEVVVNKVVAHLPSAPALGEWANETLAQGIRHVVLVGGSSRYIPYPGPPVVEADRICASVLGPREGLVGNIAIPQREGEAHRMLAKTRAGAAFFTTQILFDSESLLRTLREYEALCSKAGLTPATVLLSFAPIADETDAEFVRWLGADIPEVAERSMLNGDEGQAGLRSIQHAERVWDEVVAGATAEGLSLPIGVNVEQLTQRHLVVAVEMLRSLVARLRSSPAG
jgi:5,10-methylenetetrahydrofolate reductase